MRVFSVGGTDSSPEEEEKEVAGGFAHHSDRRDASRDARASTALRLGRRLHPEQRRGLLVDPHRCVFALCVTRQKTKGVFLVFVPSQLARLTYLYRRYDIIPVRACTLYHTKVNDNTKRTNNLHRRKSYHAIWHDADFHLISKYTDYLII